MKIIHPSGVLVLLHAQRQTDGRIETGMAKLIDVFLQRKLRE
jgi:hypothetical protein